MATKGLEFSVLEFIPHNDLRKKVEVLCPRIGAFKQLRTFRIHILPNQTSMHESYTWVVLYF